MCVRDFIDLGRLTVNKQHPWVESQIEQKKGGTRLSTSIPVFASGSLRCEEATAYYCCHTTNRSHHNAFHITADCPLKTKHVQQETLPL